MAILELVGRTLVFGGLTMAAVGGLLMLLSKMPWLEQWPGTLRIERPGFTCSVPVLLSIVISVILTLVLNVIVRIMQRGGQ